MFFFLSSIGGFLLILGVVMTLADTLLRNWSRLKRGFLFILISIPFVVGAVMTAPTPPPAKAGAKEVKSKDPFYNALQKAREVAAKVEASRQPEAESPASAAVNLNLTPNGLPAQEGQTTPAATSAPTPSLNERIASNRATFKSLETDFAQLNVTRQTLDRKNPAAISDFNLLAKEYQNKLETARFEQAILVELARTNGQ